MAEPELPDPSADGPAASTDAAGDDAAGPAPGVGVAPVDDEDRGEKVESPAKVMRVGTMVKQLLDEVRNAPLDEASRERMKDIYQSSVRELATSLSPDLRDELARLTLPFDEGVPSDAELRVAQAQLVGWLEGLFHGIQATLFAQQMAARQQLEDMRGRPQMGPGGPMGAPGGGEDARPGTYL